MGYPVATTALPPVTTVYGHLFSADDVAALPEPERNALTAILTGQQLAVSRLGGAAPYLLTVPADESTDIRGVILAALTGGLQLDNAGSLTVGVAADSDALIACGTATGISVANTGTLVLNGSVRNLGVGGITLTSQGETATLTVYGDVTLAQSGAIAITNCTLIAGDVTGKDLTLTGSGRITGNLSGGGIAAAETVTVTVNGGEIGSAGKILAGLTGSVAAGASEVTITGAAVIHSQIYGGGDSVAVTGLAKSTIGGTGSAVTLNAHLYGGGRGATGTVGGVLLTLNSGTTMAVNCNTFGGGYNAQVSGNVTVSMTGGTHQFLYGGGYNDGTGNADVLGSTSVTVTGGTALRTYGGGHNANVTGDTNVTLGDGTTILTVARGVFAGGYGNANVGGTAHLTLKSNVTTVMNILGGGHVDTVSQNQVVTASNVTVSGGTTQSYLFGGSLVTGGGRSEVATTAIAISNGTFNGRVAGGGCSGGTGSRAISSSVTISISGGIFNDLLLGGGTASQGASCVVNNVYFQIQNGIFNNQIFGGGFSSGGTCNVGSVNMLISGGTFFNDIAGGGVATTPAISVNSTVGSTAITLDMTQNVINFNNKHVYGGGNQKSTVSGTTSITIKGGSTSNSLSSLASISGDGATIGSVGGTKTLIFDGYQNSLSTNLLNFNKVSLLNGAQVSLTGAQDLTLVNNWQLAADNTPTTALLDWGNATNGFGNDTMAFDVTGWTSATVGATQTLMHGAAAAFTGWSANMTISIAGVSAAWDHLLNGWKTAEWAVSVEPVENIDNHTIMKLAKLA